MKMRTAYLLLAATGCLGMAGCSSSSNGEGATGSVKMTLKRMHSCSELESTLKADARAKMNRQIDAMIESVHRGYANGGYGNGGFGGAVPPTAESGGAKDGSTSAPTPGSPTTGTGSSSGSATNGAGDSAASHSDTNTQVAGVDEADIVKTNGKYIFLLHGQSFQVLNAWPSNELANASSLAIEGEPSEMFVEGDHAVIYSTVDGTPVYAAAGVTPRPGYSDGYGYAYASRGAVDAVAPYPGGGVYYGQPLTKITVLSLSGAAATVAREVYFEGSYLSSRRVDNHVRTVLSGGAHGPVIKYWLDYDASTGATPTYPQTEAEYVTMYETLRAKNNAAINATTSADWLPYTFSKTGAAVTATSQKCEDLWVPPTGTTEYGMTQVEAIDLNAPTDAPKGQAIMGAVDTVYSSTNAMYLASRSWNDPFVSVMASTASSGSSSGSGGTTVSSPPSTGTASPPTPTPAPATPSNASSVSTKSVPFYAADTEVTVNFTYLHKFDLASDPSSPTYVASGVVAGNIKDQFSMDERNDVLRISTTEQKALLNPSPNAPWQNRTSNNVFALAQSGDTLVTQGAVTGLASGETIFSTRFVGRYGYVVTFLQKDPLFVVDLENPAAPSLVGQLSIPGFSTYMHPLDDGHLLTIGMDADANGRQTGLALQIFDVTNPTTPKQTAKYTFSGSEYGYSDATYDHKAFTYFADKKLLAFPFVAYGTNGMRSSLEVFDIDAAAGTNGITRRGSVDHTALFGANTNGYCGGYYSPNVRRGVFLENVVYSISYAGVIASDVASLSTPVSTLALPSPYDASYSGCGGPVPVNSGGQDVPTTPGTGTATPKGG